MAAPKWVERPGEAHVGNHLYTILWASGDEWDAARHPEAAAAVTEGDLNTITVRLKQGMAESVYQELLLHELTHAGWNATMLTHAPLDAIEDVEEFIVAAQTPVLLGILRDNPHIVKYLQSSGTVVR